MTAPAEAAALAAKICERFGETGERQRRQVERMVMLMGAAWVRDTAEVADAVLGDAGAPLWTWEAVMAWTPERAEDAQLRADNEPRTRGGVFFQVARASAFIVPGKSREVYATFCWREPSPRKARPAPLPRARGGPSWSVGRVPRMPEVAVRRRAVAS